MHKKSIFCPVKEYVPLKVEAKAKKVLNGKKPSSSLK